MGASSFPSMPDIAIVAIPDCTVSIREKPTGIPLLKNDKSNGTIKIQHILIPFFTE
jgi:hypothetical protein